MTERFGGIIAFKQMMEGIARGAVEVPVATDAGLITTTYGLRILGMTGSDRDHPIEIDIGYWLVDERLTGPYDYVTQTPDGVGGFITPADPTAMVTAPAEGAHDHVGVGSHSHSDPQGGGTGAASVDIPGSGDPSQSGQHYHRVLTPRWFRPLMPFDYVAVAWLDNGRVPYVTSRIASSLMLLPHASGGGYSTIPAPPHGSTGATPVYSETRGIPTPTGPPESPTDRAGPPTGLPTVTVAQPGDTLAGIASRYGVSQEQVEANNPHYVDLPALPPYVMVVVDKGGT